MIEHVLNHDAQTKILFSAYFVRGMDDESWIFKIDPNLNVHEIINLEIPDKLKARK